MGMGPNQQQKVSSQREESCGQLSRLFFLYHALSETPNDYSYTLTTGQFRAHAALWAEIRAGGSPCFWPELTFDDGHISNLKLALPILRAYDLTAQFFITAGWTGRKRGYLGWSDVRILLDCGQQIGAHGWSHAFLTECNHDELKQELLASRLMLEDKLGIEIRTMACPGGRYNRRVVAACKEAGYNRVFTSVPEAEQQFSSFLAGRVNARSEMTAEQLRALVTPGGKALRTLKRQYFAKEITKKLLTNRIYDRLWWKFSKNPENAETDFEADEDSARYQ
jgi:peptidoglycan/xylan/chitin deacetylase (PgdA/CDA1 family)